MSNRKIYIYCDGGFGNRFNILVGGLFLSKRFNLNPIIFWKENNWCGAKFSDIFYPTIRSMDFNGETFFKLNNLKVICHDNQFNQQINSIQPNVFNSTQEISEYIGNDDDVFYFNNLIPSWVDENFLQELNRLLKFKTEITNIVYSILQKHPSNTYSGLHFRKTDFVGIELVDEDYYHNYIESNPNEKFFVCSDDQKTEIEFSRHPNVFTFEKSNYVQKYSDGEWNTWIVDSNGNQFPFNVDRNSQSVIEAIVDLLLLSNSNIINTNLNSTFLKTAILLKKYNLFR